MIIVQLLTESMNNTRKLQIKWMRNNELIVSGDEDVIFYQGDFLECGLFSRY